MRASLQGLEGDVRDLCSYATFLEAGLALQAGPLAAGDDPPSEALRNQQERARQISSATARTLAYNSLIVSMYGALERFMEDLVRAYVSYLNGICPRYGDLPQAIQDQHLDVTLALIRNLEHPRFNVQVQAEGLVSNLHSCLQDAQPYHLNDLAFTLHTANFRTPVVEKFLGRVGLDGSVNRVLGDSGFKAALEELDPGAPPSFTRFNDMVDRRNEVAHGTPPNQILSLELLRAYATMVGAFGSAVYERVFAASLGHLAACHGQPLGRPLAVYQHGRVVTFDLAAGRIELGDPIVAQRSNGVCSFTHVESIMINGVDVPVADAAAGTQQVGLRLEGAVRATYELSVLPATTPAAHLAIL